MYCERAFYCGDEKESRDDADEKRVERIHMLLDLHVKNLALIEEEEIHFGRGLNILTGETGAGKSIILGALGIALGKKASREILRRPEEDGLAEAVFAVTSPAQRQVLAELEIPVYDDQVIFSRRISSGRTISKINGETLPAQTLKRAGEAFLDVYGQNEQQTLLKKSRHLALLDAFAGEEIDGLKGDLSLAYRAYVDLKKEADSASLDLSARLREISFLEHEVEEIKEVELAIGEDLNLEAEYRKMKYASKITEELDRVRHLLSDESACGDLIAKAIHSLRQAEDYDSKIGDYLSALMDIESLISDVSGEIDSHLEDAAFDEERFYALEQRLDLINDLKAKYGRSIEEILAALEDKQKELFKLQDYDRYQEELKKRLTRAEEAYLDLARQVSARRKQAAKKLCARVSEALLSLNFLSANFQMRFTETSSYTAGGIDEAEFYISTNPGEEARPLSQVASGGELSRIMLVIKTELAAREDLVDSLIFDEVDAGISGKTAQAVARKLRCLGREVQVICITHLPLIAAEADRHFLIEKSLQAGRTVSGIRQLDEEETVRELARMISGDVISESVLENARQMRDAAAKEKRDQ